MFYKRDGFPAYPTADAIAVKPIAQNYKQDCY